MPFFTISTVFVLAAVFAAGGLVSWYLNDRKHERERERLEQSMTRALEQRYHMYESLEASVRSLFTRMDEVRERWQEQLAGVRASVEGNLGESSFVRRGVEGLIGRVEEIDARFHSKLDSMLQAGAATRALEPSHTLMRVDNPELWDLEREFERRNAEQLSEISAKSQRVTELMDKITSLEPTALQLAERDREFVALEEQHHQLQARARQLEAEREQLAATNQALAETRRVRIAELNQRLESELQARKHEVGELEARVAELVERGEQQDRTHRQALAELEARVAELVARAEQEGRTHKQALGELEFRVAELCVERDGLRQEYETSIEVASEQRLQFERELDAEREAAQDLRARIAELEGRALALGEEVKGRDEILADREMRLDQLQTRLRELQSALETRAAELDERERKFQELQSAWRLATGQVESQRTRLATHKNHFQAAQQMLAQLKPMLVELETRLAPADDDGPTVIVTDAMTERDLVVNDGTLEELPAEAVEVGPGEAPHGRFSADVETPRAALPAAETSADPFDLSTLDADLSQGKSPSL
jgi:chromosome segregation ATPase